MALVSNVDSAAVGAMFFLPGAFTKALVGLSVELSSASALTWPTIAISMLGLIKFASPFSGIAAAWPKPSRPGGTGGVARPRVEGRRGAKALFCSPATSTKGSRSGTIERSQRILCCNIISDLYKTQETKESQCGLDQSEDGWYSARKVGREQVRRLVLVHHEDSFRIMPVIPPVGASCGGYPRQNAFEVLRHRVRP
ncbi:hypothetical protein K461DRAFT_48347 [Myriangium duriaei CBS 260.36]|uniref:Uncharacterized protein n=1 Tax=Myriangium duriaei CBS 260.36 TaxID=1168546 RepID=A0A9P4ME38_9PEZI|nr:hypothetical protein K461DRAFT_48347 [Myriangium duriaei CBS 260.36]